MQETGRKIGGQTKALATGEGDERQDLGIYISDDIHGQSPLMKTRHPQSQMERGAEGAAPLFPLCQTDHGGPSGVCPL